jgi:hypothetical protein
MRKRMLQVVSIGAAILILSMAAADAQKSRIAIVGKIPFAFQAGDSRLPAGKYIVKNAVVSASSVITIYNVESRSEVMVLTHPAAGDTRNMQPRLVFNKYGSVYFLSRILSPADGIGQELKKGMHEKELIANAVKISTIEVAMTVR